MLFTAPTIDSRELAVLGEVDELRVILRRQLHEPRRWTGSLRRLSFARNIRGSNTIEGFDAELDDAAAIALGEEPMDADSETRHALEGYRNAMTYILQLAQEPPVDYSTQLLKSLHFMMTQHRIADRPGRWRQGAIFVREERTGRIVHEGADIVRVPELMDELVAGLGRGDQPPIVDAAIAHLNLVMIHPFRDGNGRMARAVQSLVLAAEGTLSPVFMSIEEHLGRNTEEYYAVLAEVGGGSWNPTGDTRPWVRFCLRAHLAQAKTLQRRVKDSDRLWQLLEHALESHRLPERVLAALFDAALGLRVRSATYRAALLEGGEVITEATAGRDLARLVEAGLLRSVGEKRGRHYLAGEELAQLQQAVTGARDPKDLSDPFA